MSLPDDQLFDDLDDDGSAVRVAAFQRDVDRNIAILMSPKKFDTKKRLAAARWLGESGEPKAIESLVKVYKRDRSANMRQAAEYALGQFRALEMALEGTAQEQDEALQLIEQIVNKGQMGSRTRWSGRRLGIISVVLMALLAVWIVLASVLGPQQEAGPIVAAAISATPAPELPTSTPTPTPDPGVTVRDLQALYISIDEDARALQEQYNTITRQEAQNCGLVFNAPEALSTDLNLANFPAIGELAEALEALRVTIEALRDPFQTSCRTGIAIARTQALRLGDELIAAQITLAQVPELFNAIDLNRVINNPDAAPVATQAPDNVAATIAPSPTFANLQVHALTATGVISEMSNLRGANTLLLQYWTDVQTGGATAGCREIPPTIPQDYVLPAQDQALAPAALIDAIETLNLGLNLTRQSWAAFNIACSDNSLTEIVSAQIQFTQLAQEAYVSADQQLRALLR